MNNSLESPSPTKNILYSLRFPIIILAILILGGGFIMSQRSSPPSQPNPSYPTPIPTVQAGSRQSSDSIGTLLYGVWEEGKSIVKSINSDSSNHITAVKLPSNVKDINILSETELLYIAETNDKDHGRKVNIYNTQTTQTRTLFEADADFGIDDIVISPNKNWVASWEVRFAPNANALTGGTSRVYTVNLAVPTNKILIVEEQNVSKTNPLRYPLFFDAQNRLFLDTFAPNGGGWNLGLWLVNSEGTNLSRVPEMNDGSYSIDPILSMDGKKVVFTAYDPNASLQLSPPPTGGILRPAIVNPNLLQIMDLSNFQKTTLLGSADGAQYANPLWSEAGDKIAYQKFKVSNSDTSEYEGTFIYNLTTGETTQVAVLGKTYPLEILEFKKELLLVGTPSQYAENTGNLGSNYGSAFEQFFLVDPLKSSSTTIVAGVSLQFIEYLNKNPKTFSALSLSSQVTSETSPSSLKLKSFEMKPIAQVRGPQQNESPNLPRCRDLLGKEKQKEWAAAKKEGKCHDSPLYLYPEKETFVTVKVHPPAQILYSEPLYKNGWKVLAKPDSQLRTIEGKTLSKISYTYLTSEVKPPIAGLVTKREEFKDVLEIYANNLGLQSQEKEDFVAFWLESLPESSFYFISHFNQKESQTLLPLEIDPKPESLIQVIMYFKPLEKSIDVPPPVFEKTPQRAGFVAVDWSGIVDY